MAGMLPGVECARRRRFHQGGAMELQSGTRRSSFCLYRSGHDSHLSSGSLVLACWFPPQTQQRSACNKSTQSEGLGDAAREARERLDERLRAQRASQITRHNNSTGSSGNNNNNNNSQYEGGVMSSGAALAKLQREVFCSKKKGFRWGGRLGWKAAAAEQDDDDDDCAVCLEEFRGGDVLVHLPCAHRFHRRCVLPWLESSSHCPCCRTEITSDVTPHQPSSKRPVASSYHTTGVM